MTESDYECFFTLPRNGGYLSELVRCLLNLLRFEINVIHTMGQALIIFNSRDLPLSEILFQMLLSIYLTTP